MRVWFFTEEGKVRNRLGTVMPEVDLLPGHPELGYSSKKIAQEKRKDWLPVVIPMVEGNLKALEQTRKVGKKKLRRLRKLWARITREGAEQGRTR